MEGNRQEEQQKLLPLHLVLMNRSALYVQCCRRNDPIHPAVGSFRSVPGEQVNVHSDWQFSGLNVERKHRGMRYFHDTVTCSVLRHTLCLTSCNW